MLSEAGHVPLQSQAGASTLIGMCLPTRAGTARKGQPSCDSGKGAGLAVEVIASVRARSSKRYVSVHRLQREAILSCTELFAGQGPEPVRVGGCRVLVRGGSQPPIGAWSATM